VIGANLLKQYSGSLIKALEAIYPEHEWKLWLFDAPAFPSGYWESSANTSKYLTWLAKQLNVSELEGWYTVPYQDVMKQKCSYFFFPTLFFFFLLDDDLLIVYSVGAYRAQKRVGGLMRLLKIGFPAHDWQEWKFNYVGAGFWDSLDNQRRFLHWLERELNIQSLSDWYDIMAVQVEQKGGSSAVAFFFCFFFLANASRVADDASRGLRVGFLGF
jgi:hypothetical protein